MVEQFCSLALHVSSIKRHGPTGLQHTHNVSALGLRIICGLSTTFIHHNAWQLPISVLAIGVSTFWTLRTVHAHHLAFFFQKEILCTFPSQFSLVILGGAVWFTTGHCRSGVTCPFVHLSKDDWQPSPKIAPKKEKVQNPTAIATQTRAVSNFLQERKIVEKTDTKGAFSAKGQQEPKIKKANPVVVLYRSLQHETLPIASTFDNSAKIKQITKKNCHDSEHKTCSV